MTQMINDTSNLSAEFLKSANQVRGFASVVCQCPQSWQASGDTRTALASRGWAIVCFLGSLPPFPIPRFLTQSRLGRGWTGSYLAWLLGGAPRRPCRCLSGRNSTCLHLKADQQVASSLILGKSRVYSRRDGTCRT